MYSSVIRGVPLEGCRGNGGGDDDTSTAFVFVCFRVSKLAEKASFEKCR